MKTKKKLSDQKYFNIHKTNYQKLSDQKQGQWAVKEKHSLICIIICFLRSHPWKQKKNLSDQKYFNIRKTNLNMPSNQLKGNKKLE